MDSTSERYQRQIRLKEIRKEGQQKLAEARVLVVGAGGLGCPALQFLAAAGVGDLGIIDHDKVELSNLHRQILFTTADIGSNKALAAKNRLQQLNPEISIKAYQERFSARNGIEHCRDYDIIIDGTDNFTTRYIVNDACVISKKPYVYGAIFKFQGQVSVFNHQDGPTYRCLFPTPPGEATIPSCEVIGVLGTVPGIIGNIMANEVLKMILDIGEILSGKLWTFNTLTNETTIMKISANREEIKKVIASSDSFSDMDYATFCGETMEIEAVTFDQMTTMDDPCFIDLREKHEEPVVQFDGLIRLPFSILREKIDDLPGNRPIAMFCQSGIRSKKAVDFLKGNGFSNVYCLKENAPELNLRFGRKSQRTNS